MGGGRWEEVLGGRRKYEMVGRGGRRSQEVVFVSCEQMFPLLWFFMLI